MKYPEDLDVPIMVVQQIQISHNFTESYIITEEKEWNSASFYNQEKEIVIVLVLEKYDDGNDFVIVLEEFNQELQKDINKDKLKAHLKSMFDFSQKVFRTRDEVFSKLSNELADMQMQLFFIERRINKFVRSDNLSVKAKITLLLNIHNELSFTSLEKMTAVNSISLKNTIVVLINDKIIKHDQKKDIYLLNR